MDTRTMIRELDEVIERARSTAEREAAMVEALPNCSLRRRKLAQLQKMRSYVHRLRRLRSTVGINRRPGLRQN
jgi:hypothetical protein